MKAKAPRARVYRGDLGGAPNQGRHPRPLEIGAQQKVFKKGAGGLKLIRSWRIKKKKTLSQQECINKTALPYRSPSPETPAYPACAFGAPHPFNNLLVIAAIPRKGRDEGIVRSRSCDEPNIVRSRILRTTGSRPRSPLRRTIYRSEELTFSCKSSILLLPKVMLGCFTQVRFARPHDEHLFAWLYKEHARRGYYAHRALASPPELSFATASPSSYAYHELESSPSHGPEEAKRPSPLTAEGSATRWRAFRSRPKTPILLEFRSDPHSHRSLLIKPKESQARIAFFGSTKGEQNGSLFLGIADRFSSPSFVFDSR
ncbi:hypothetical protein GBA52_015378 [Prunus armeniaca]|nr:hypothetical protein GBA52_015378 [Prunus armeniaca]